MASAARGEPPRAGRARADAPPVPRPARDGPTPPRRGRPRRWAGPAALLLAAAPPALTLVSRALPPPVTPLMLIRLAEGHALRREWVAYEEIAPALAERDCGGGQ